jgi:hypothetical protein
MLRGQARLGGVEDGAQRVADLAAAMLDEAESPRDRGAIAIPLER